jgi:hypothetical protein
MGMGMGRGGGFGGVGEVCEVGDVMDEGGG